MKLFSLLIAFAATVNGDARCDLEPIMGRCKADMTRWHYDSVDNTCKEFAYGNVTEILTWICQVLLNFLL